MLSCDQLGGFTATFFFIFESAGFFQTVGSRLTPSAFESFACAIQLAAAAAAPVSPSPSTAAVSTASCARSSEPGPRQFIRCAASLPPPHVHFPRTVACSFFLNRSATTTLLTAAPICSPAGAFDGSGKTSSSSLSCSESSALLRMDASSRPVEGQPRQSARRDAGPRGALGRWGASGKKSAWRTGLDEERLGVQPVHPFLAVQRRRPH